MSIVKSYFDYFEKYQKDYNQIVILMQIGSFYEIYGISNKRENIGNVEEISQLLNIQMTRKNKNIIENDRKNPLLCGFPLISLEKYLPVLVNNNYTVIIIDQLPTQTKTIERKVSGIYSPGTTFDNISDSNYLVSIYIEQIKHNYVIGVSAIDVSTGQVVIYECFGEKNEGLDKVHHFIKAFPASEIVINGKDISYDYITSFLEIENILVHKQTTFNKDYTKPKFQNEYLSKIFKNETLLSTVEFLDIENKIYGTISLLILIDFIYHHNETVLLNLKNPLVYNPNVYLSLLNNSVTQLDILTTLNIKKSKVKYTTVFDVVNKTKTIIGKRKLKNDLLFPIIDVGSLNKRYTLIESVKDINTTKITFILSKILDLEKIFRKVSLGILNPFEWSTIDVSIKGVFGITELLNDSFKEIIYFDKNELQTFIKEYSSTFDLEEMGKYNLNSIENSFIKKGINDEIDIVQTEIINLEQKLNNLADYMSQVIGNVGSVKVSYIEKEGYYLSTTNIRSVMLKKNMSQADLNNLSLVSNKGGTKIVSKEINTISNKLVCKKNTIRDLVKDVYICILKKFYQDYTVLFKNIILFVGEIDVIINNYIVAKEFNYTRPTLKNSERSSVNTIGIRHPLIERINDSVMYISNDISVGDESIILYAINSSGKTSLIKSLGIAIVMAQAGMFVACESIVLSPFKTIISRISGSDCILKGQSSFIVEMIELKTILKHSNKNTIVLGDEICSSTEFVSATSLVASMVLELHKMECPFILVTHIHQLYKLQKIKDLESVKIKHLSIKFENDNIIFDRKLKDGGDLDIYGLEVAKFTGLPKEFMDTAFEIRNELVCKPKNVVSSKKSVYNKDKIINNCEICNYKPVKQDQLPLDVHHILFQCQANSDGIINGKFHKNELHNLVTLCKECHIKVHKNEIVINGYIQTSKGKKLNFK